MSIEQQPPTIQDIANLAAMLRVQFSEHETTFDLDHTNPTLEGTYRKTPISIEAAYGDLMRFRLLMRDIQLGGPTMSHLALECQQLPDNVASLLKALTAYFVDQSDPTGLKVFNLRSQVQSLQMTFRHMDDLLGIIEQRDKEQR